MECMTLAEIFATTIFSVKLMHDCIGLSRVGYIGVKVPNERPFKRLMVCGMHAMFETIVVHEFYGKNRRRENFL